MPSRGVTEVKGEVVKLPNGEIKRDKNGRAVRRRPIKPKPVPEVKDEEQEEDDKK